MQFTLTINQKAIIDGGFGIDLVDASILDYLRNSFSAGFGKKLVEGENIFFRVDYERIIDEMPLLGIESKDVIGRRIGKLVKCSLIDRRNVKMKNGTETFFRLGERYKELIFTHPTEKSCADLPPDSKVGTHPTEKSSHIEEDSIPSSQYTEDTSLRSVSSWSQAIAKDENKTKNFLDGIMNFVENGRTNSEEFREICRAVADKIGVDHDLAIRELPKFANNYTQVNEKWRKQKWEKEKTFDLVKRLRTWFSNAVEWRSTSGRKQWTGHL